jgi:hypothetical protein
METQELQSTVEAAVSAALNANTHLRDRPLTTAELADRWSCSIGTISEFVQAGILSPMKFSRRTYRYSMESVRAAEKFLEENGG